jgi:hypothetical protein
MWTHGNAVVVEDPSRFDAVLHRGWGTELTFAPSDGNNPDNSFTVGVFHVVMPTPPIPLDDGFVVAETIYLLFRSTGSIVISRIDIWDGFNMVSSIEPTSNAGGGIRGLGGDLLTVGRLNTFRLPADTKISNGLGVSLTCLIDASNTDASDRTLTFAAAGADFLSDPPLIHSGATARRVGGGG